MQFADLARGRRMCRDFRDVPLAAGVVDDLLDLAVRAPSAGHSQPWRFLVLEGRDQTERFWTATFTDADRAAFRWQGLFAAPVLIVPCADRGATLDRYAEGDKRNPLRDPSFFPVPYWQTDTAMATMLLLLAAADVGLGALFFGIFPPKLPAFRAAFGVPDEVDPVGAVALGYPVGTDSTSASVRRLGRRPAESVIHRGRWPERVPAADGPDVGSSGEPSDPPATT